MSTRLAIFRRLLVWLFALAIGVLSAVRLAELSAEEKSPSSGLKGAKAGDSQSVASQPDAGQSAGSTTPARQLVTLTRSTPTSVDDLLTIQAAIQQAVEKALPATVGISIRNTFGSGVVVSEDGYVLTAGHVVPSPNQNATIIFPDGKRVEAKTLGSNGNMDSGMLKITKEGKYPFVELGRSTDLKLGEWCVTLGHPNGMQRGRPPVLRAGRILYARDDAIASDCTIVGGDSGGPLLDVSGRLIGIHSRISEEVIDNYHVPIDTYRETWERLAAGDSWGGWQPAGGPLVGINGRRDPLGCRVTRVYPNTPADKAGIKIDDIVTQLDDGSVTSLDRLQTLLFKRKPGDETTLTVLRGEEKLEFKLKLGSRE